MSQTHPRSEHPSNTPSEPNNNNTNNDAHFSSCALPATWPKPTRCGGCDILLAKHLTSLITPSLPSPTSAPTLRILDNACGPLIVTNECLHTPAITSLSLFTFADPTLGARELHHTLKPHGITAATSFKSLGWLPLLHEVESVLHPSMPRRASRC